MPRALPPHLSRHTFKCNKGAPVALAFAALLLSGMGSALGNETSAPTAATSQQASEQVQPKNEVAQSKAQASTEKTSKNQTASKAGEKTSSQAAQKTTPKRTDKSPAASDYVERKDVQDYLRSVSKEKQIPYDWLEREVALARYSPLSEKYTTPRPKANKKTTPEKNFILYERNLVNNERIVRGVDFIERNTETLRRIEAETGVSGYAITAIIGVESIYGRNMGRFRVLDALMTLSFDYTRRAKYYRSELSSFLDFCYREQVSPVSVTGSFAGALGLGQFMPASLNAYGRDGDGDGKIDIVNNEADGIASVANFLAKHGWARGERPLYPVEATEAIFKATQSGGIKTHTTVGSLLKAGVKPQGKLPLSAKEPAMLVNLPWIAKDNTHGVDYYIGTDSFAAILRYNRSYFYAAAVTLLAYELEEQSADHLHRTNKPDARENTVKENVETEQEKGATAKTKLDGAA